MPGQSAPLAFSDWPSIAGESSSPVFFGRVAIDFIQLSQGAPAIQLLGISFRYNSIRVIV
jgi:hypothetical protein